MNVRRKLAKPVAPASNSSCAARDQGRASYTAKQIYLRSPVIRRSKFICAAQLYGEANLFAQPSYSEEGKMRLALPAQIQCITLAFGLALGLTACSGKSKKPSDTNGIPFSINNVGILSTSPEQGATDIKLDPSIEITFDQRIDAYSAIPENFQLYSENGTTVGGTKLVSTKFVTDPRDDKKLVSLIRVTLQGEFLIPDTRYIFTWGEPKDLSDKNASAYGIMNFYGDRLPAGAISFSTGKNFSSLRSNTFDILSMSPGRVFSRGKVFNFEGSLKDLIDRGSTESYLTVTKNAPIRILFSDAIGWIGGIDPISGVPLPEIPPTPIERFPGLMVALFDSDTAFDQLFASVLNLNNDAWSSFRTSYTRRLNGSVRSVNSRRTLVFELDQDCNGSRICEYPDTVAQAVVVIVRGLRANITGQKLGGIERYEDFIMGGFIHFSGLSVESPLKFIWDFGGNNGGRI